MAQPVTWMEDGVQVVEDPGLVEVRVNAKKEKEWKRSRHTTRRINVGISHCDTDALMLTTPYSGSTADCKLSSS
jgi:hypothetical protein